MGFWQIYKVIPEIKDTTSFLLNFISEINIYNGSMDFPILNIATFIGPLNLVLVGPNIFEKIIKL